jgi:MoxR-like ATPase
MQSPTHTWESLADTLTTCLRRGVHVLLYGPPGTGKSYLARQIAKDIDARYLHVSLPEDAMSAEIIGHRVPSSTGSWDWHDGPALAAYRLGVPLIIDEIDHGSAEAQTRLYQILDRVPVTLPTAEIVPCRDGFGILATMNGTPDNLNPLFNRFAVRIEIPEPLQTMIDALPERFRGPARDGWKPQSPDTRQWFALAQLTESLPLEIAAELLFPGRGTELSTAFKLEE